MGHAPIDNATPFSFECFFLMDEEGRPLAVPLLKATFDIVGGKRIARAEVQEPIDAAGRRASDADDASYVREPECASFVKPATDVALVGHAVAPRPGTVESIVELRVGPLGKSLAIRGDRVWVNGRSGPRITAPQPFERIPLVYERALGGWDRTCPDPAKHACEPRNPVGVGFRLPGARFEEGPLPNLEDPAHLLQNYGEHPSPPPACTGFVSQGWAPRIGLAGRFDDAWRQARMPLLPSDFDRRFFNAASPGLVANGYLAGDEDVHVSGVSAAGPLAFKLPGVRPPSCRVGVRRRPDALVPLQLDTVIIDADASRVHLLWRGHLPLPDSAHDVRWLAIS
jgi:hypothetical protein